MTPRGRTRRNFAIVYLALRGYRAKHIGRRFGVTPQRISDIVGREPWAAEIAWRRRFRAHVEAMGLPVAEQRSMARTMASLVYRD